MLQHGGRPIHLWLGHGDLRIFSVGHRAVTQISNVEAMPSNEATSRSSSLAHIEQELEEESTNGF